jgi:hypothetical protein
MTAKRLPERPDLEQLKHQAKELLRFAHSEDSAALAPSVCCRPSRTPATTSSPARRSRSTMLSR